LPIAIGILVASGQLPGVDVSQTELIGELALDGQLRKVTGVLPTALACEKENNTLIVPADNGAEAGLAERADCLQAGHLLEVCGHLVGQSQLPLCVTDWEQVRLPDSGPDIADVKGQPQAKRALEIAAAGDHSLLLVGPPGTGKSMLASRLLGLLPELSTSNALESAAVQSIAQGEFDLTHWRCRPYRAPHHSCSSAALVGGGPFPKPGEISLAHNGILFLDELTEFSRATLDQLREPLESGEINIARAAQSVSYPASFQLVAACNPCKCGFYGDGTDRCACSASALEQHRNRLSGPMLDRIDMHVHLQRVDIRTLHEQSACEESSSTVKQRVCHVRDRQMERQGKLNGQLNSRDIERLCNIDGDSLGFLELVCERLNMSARAYHRVIKLARTIADIQGDDNISKSHLAEAVGYRGLDRGVN
jgi:magnesium chelatase family protein